MNLQHPGKKQGMPELPQGRDVQTEAGSRRYLANQLAEMTRLPFRERPSLTAVRGKT